MAHDTTTRRLALLRHAKAEPGGSVADFDRVLSVEGRTQARIVGERMLEADRIPGTVLCSAAVRAKQTWQIVATALGDRAQRVDVRYLEDLYGADTDELLDVLRGLGDDVTSALVVGHEPILSATAHLLAGPTSQESAALRVRTGLSTATAALFELHGPWGRLGPRAAVLTGLSTAPVEA